MWTRGAAGWPSVPVCSRGCRAVIMQRRRRLVDLEACDIAVWQGDCMWWLTNCCCLCIIRRVQCLLCGTVVRQVWLWRTRDILLGICAISSKNVQLAPQHKGAIWIAAIPHCEGANRLPSMSAAAIGACGTGAVASCARSLRIRIES